MLLHLSFLYATCVHLFSIGYILVLGAVLGEGSQERGERGWPGVKSGGAAWGNRVVSSRVWVERGVMFGRVGGGLGVGELGGEAEGVGGGILEDGEGLLD